MFFGLKGRGTIQTANVKHFVRCVDEETHGQGLQVVLADGGFDVVGRENQQELLSKQVRFRFTDSQDI